MSLQVPSLRHVVVASLTGTALVIETAFVIDGIVSEARSVSEADVAIVIDRASWQLPVASTAASVNIVWCLMFRNGGLLPVGGGDTLRLFGLRTCPRVSQKRVLSTDRGVADPKVSLFFSGAGQ